MAKVRKPRVGPDRTAPTLERVSGGKSYGRKELQNQKAKEILSSLIFLMNENFVYSKIH
jgi:hypothetical protein